MKIGELAKSTNISVRTLHHYDEIGLLKPSSRSESGHRLYDKGDVMRLHRILALRQLDLSLEEISLCSEYFSEQHLADLVEREKGLGFDTVKGVLDELPQLTAQIHQSMAAGVPPSAQR